MRKQVEALVVSSALILGACSSGEAETTALDEVRGTQSPITQPEVVEASPTSVVPVETTLPEPVALKQDSYIGSCEYYGTPSNSSPTYIPGDVDYNPLRDPNLLMEWQEEYAEERELPKIGLGTLVCYVTEGSHNTPDYNNQLLTLEATDLAHYLVSNDLVFPQKRPTSD